MSIGRPSHLAIFRAFKHSRPASQPRSLLGLEVIEEDVALLGFLAPVADDDAGAVDDFTGVAFAIELA